MADADIGFGTLIKRGTGTGTIVYSAVGQVIDLSLPSLSRDMKEATHYASPGGWREYIPGLKEAGEVKFTIQFSDIGAMDTVLADIQLKTTVPYEIEFPDATKWDFVGLVQTVTPVAPIDDRMTAEVTIKISGKPGFIV